MTERVPEHLLDNGAQPFGWDFLRGLPPTARLITTLGLCVIGLVVSVLVSWHDRSSREDLLNHGETTTASVIAGTRGSTPYQYEYSYQGKKYTGLLRSSEFVSGQPVEIVFAPSYPDVSVIKDRLPGFKEMAQLNAWFSGLIACLAPLSAILMSVGLTDDYEGFKFDDDQKAVFKKWRLLALAFAALAAWPASQVIMLLIKSNASS